MRRLSDCILSLQKIALLEDEQVLAYLESMDHAQANPDAPTLEVDADEFS